MTSKGFDGSSPDEQTISLRDEQKLLTRKRLLDASLSVFRRKSYAEATIQDLVREANTSRATFYLHFRNKVDVVNAIMDELGPDVEDFYGRLDAVLAGGTHEDFKVWLSQALEWCDEHLAIAQALNQVAAAGGPLAADVETRYDVSDYMPRYLASFPKNRRDEARLRVALLPVFLTNVSVRRGNPRLIPDSLSNADIVDFLADMWHPVLRIS